jgi:uncharacterized membrane protein YedE/YeeE
MNALVALLAGLLFGTGLLLSGMTDPANVLGFLDVTGAWRPGLALVMAGAVALALPAFAFVRHRGRSLRGVVLLKTNQLNIDQPLLLGSSVFGIGWGLSGICPGPGVILLASGVPGASIFAISLIVGIYAADSFAADRPRGAEPVDELGASADFREQGMVCEQRSTGFG